MKSGKALEKSAFTPESGSVDTYDLHNDFNVLGISFQMHGRLQQQRKHFLENIVSF